MCLRVPHCHANAFGLLADAGLTGPRISAVSACLQELAPGTALADLVMEGRSFDEAEVVRIACQLLELLQFLAGRSPPVVHRYAPVVCAWLTHGLSALWHPCDGGLPACSLANTGRS